MLAGGFQLVVPWRVRLLGRVRILVLPVRSSADHAAGEIRWALVTLSYAGKSNVTPIAERCPSFYAIMVCCVCFILLFISNWYIVGTVTLIKKKHFI